MKKYVLEITYLFIGLILGMLGFYMIHDVFPHDFHEEIAAKRVWKPRSMEKDLPYGEKGDLIKYGHALITQTSALIGPLAKNDSMQFAGNNLTCNNCHLNAGRKIGAGSFIGVANRFPQFRGRENKIGTLEERINGCMERSMAGSVMDEKSKEMKAMVAYMEWLSEGVPQEVEQLYKGYVKIQIPTVKANPDQGKLLYDLHCVRCHMDQGEGMRKPGEDFTGYIYPPLSGPDSYNDGAGMNRVLTAAEFIKGNMPFGATHDSPVLTDLEAYHVAAYINTFSRPGKANKEVDFPDKKLKPVSTPYGPWADDFSAEQHKFGPFLPIIEYYKEEYDITKTK